MKKLVLTTFAIAATLFVSAQKGASSSVKLTSENTSVTWLGKKVGGRHEGAISVKEGVLSLEKGALQSGKIVIDMNSITCTDIADKEKNAYLVGHLKNEDFFNVAAHQTATLEITSAKAAKGGKVAITGNLTIKGITKPVSFMATVNSKNGFKATSTLVFDRTNYDIKYASGIIGTVADKAIEDNVTLKITIK
jgi:polyisoprenoid-binding protein YceI